MFTLYIFRDVVETVCKAVAEMDYYYWRMRVRSIDKLIEDSVEHAEGKSTTNAMKETAYAMLEFFLLVSIARKISMEELGTLTCQTSTI